MYSNGILFEVFVHYWKDFVLHWENLENNWKTQKLPEKYCTQGMPLEPREYACFTRVNNLHLQPKVLYQDIVGCNDKIVIRRLLFHHILAKHSFEARSFAAFNKWVTDWQRNIMFTVGWTLTMSLVSWKACQCRIQTLMTIREIPRIVLRFFVNS